MVKPDDPKPARLWRFCGKSEKDVRHLVTTGNAVIPEKTICDECVDLCNAIIETGTPEE